MKSTIFKLLDCLGLVKASRLNFLGNVRKSESLLFVRKQDDYERERGVVMIIYPKQLCKIISKLNHLHIILPPCHRG